MNNNLPSVKMAFQFFHGPLRHAPFRRRGHLQARGQCLCPLDYAQFAGCVSVARDLVLFRQSEPHSHPPPCFRHLPPRLYSRPYTLPNRPECALGCHALPHLSTYCVSLRGYPLLTWLANPSLREPGKRGASRRGMVVQGKRLPHLPGPLRGGSERRIILKLIFGPRRKLKHRCTLSRLAASNEHDTVRKLIKLLELHQLGEDFLVTAVDD